MEIKWFNVCLDDFKQTIEDVLSGLLTQKLGHKVELLQGWNQTLEDLITDGSADRINFFWRCGFAQT